MTQLSIITVNYYLADELGECVASLEHCLRDLDYEIIVVDNDSQDEAFREFVRLHESNPRLQVLCLETNVGFGRACNAGAELARSDMFCFLNPDTRLDDDVFRPMLDTFHDDPDLWALGPRMNEPRLLDYSAGYQPNFWFELLQVFWIGRYLEAVIVRLRSVVAKQPVSVGWVVGACLMMPRSAFTQLGGFDPDYFLFFEEVDLCRRAQSRGGRVAYLPSRRIRHYGSVSGKRDYQRFTQRFYTSKLLFMEKNFRSTTKVIMIALVRLQLCSQIVLWGLLFPLQRHKAKQKISACLQVVMPRAAHNPRI